MGRVEDGNTVSDFDPEEARRGISVWMSIAPFEHEDHKVNVLDTPGYADFVGDVAAAFRAADLAVFVVSAVEGVEVQTEMAWRIAEQAKLPRAVFVNKLDRERASFPRTLDDLKAKFGAGVAPLELPIGEEASFRGVVDLLTDTAVTYDGTTGKGAEGPVPDEMEGEEHTVHDALIEGIVVADDDLMERYLADESIDVKELEQALAKGIAEATVFPVLCGSGTKLIGVDRLASFVVHEGPAPTSEDVDGAAPPLAFVFKTIVDPYVGRVNLFKVLQGSIKTDASLVNNRTVSDERLHQLSVMRGKEQESTAEVPAGDIAAVAKLRDTSTGDVLGARGVGVTRDAVEAPTAAVPVVDVKVTCFDGKYHSVDSSEMSFKMAGSLGFKEAMAKANPILLEPISELVVIAPEQYQGDLMGDLNSKRGRIQGSGAVGHGEMEIVAQVPTSEVLRYAIDLRSLTAGLGRCELTHSHHAPG